MEIVAIIGFIVSFTMLLACAFQASADIDNAYMICVVALFIATLSSAASTTLIPQDSLNAVGIILLVVTYLLLSYVFYILLFNKKTLKKTANIANTTGRTQSKRSPKGNNTKKNKSNCSKE